MSAAAEGPLGASLIREPLCPAGETARKPAGRRPLEPNSTFCHLLTILSIFLSPPHGFSDWRPGEREALTPHPPPHPRLKKSKINEYRTAAAMLKPVYFLYILRYENIKVPSAFHSTFSGIRAPTRNGLVCLILKLGHIFQIMKLFIQQYLRQNFHCRV